MSDLGSDPGAVTIIRGGLLLNLRGHGADLADLLVIGDTIHEIGPPGMEAPAQARTLDASDRLLMPGLVNAHTHGHGNLVKGSGDRWTLEALLNAGPYLNGNRVPEDKYLSGLLGGLDMIRAGTTACYDLFHEFPTPTLEGLTALARGYRDAGLRVVIAPMVADHSFYEAIPGLMDALPEGARQAVARFRAAPREETLAALERIVAGWPFAADEAGLALAPTIPQHCSDAFMLACRDMARANGLGLHMHLGESKVQALSGLRRYGRTLTAHLERIGFLGPNLTAAHAVWLDGDDLALLAANGVRVAHNPGSNLRLGSGIAPVREMLDRGITVGIGSDGPHCSDNQNLFEAMRLAATASRIRSVDPAQWIATEEALEMATEGSAAALGLAGKIGRIAPGYKADIVFLDLGHPNLIPLNDPTNQLVHTENGAAVASVMVGGRLVLDQGRITGIDVAALRRRATARAAELRQVNAGTRAVAEEIGKAVGCFCVGLAREPYHVRRLVAEACEGPAGNRP